MCSSSEVYYSLVKKPRSTSVARRCITEARELYKDCSYDELYDPVLMPLELRKAHIANDRAVMAAYGFSLKMSEEDCVAELMKLYQKILIAEKMKKVNKKSKKK